MKNRQWITGWKPVPHLFNRPSTLAQQAICDTLSTGYLSKDSLSNIKILRLLVVNDQGGSALLGFELELIA